MRHQLNARNLLCPMPVIKVQNTIKTLCLGDELEVFSTDPGALQDIPSWCRMYGHYVMEIAEEGRDIRFLIKVCKND